MQKDLLIWFCVLFCNLQCNFLSLSLYVYLNTKLYLIFLLELLHGEFISTSAGTSGYAPQSDDDLDLNEEPEEFRGFELVGIKWLEKLNSLQAKVLLQLLTIIYEKVSIDLPVQYRRVSNYGKFLFVYFI